MLKKIFKKWWFWPLLLGVLVRIILMPITLHVDLWGHSFTAYFLAYEGKLNPYDTLANLPADNPIVRNFGITDIFIYPPLTYFTLGFFRILIKPFVDPGFLPFVMQYPTQVYERGDLFLNFFLYKLPYLFIDVGLAFLLSSLFEETKKKKMAFSIWMFNPVALYTTFMIGQIDIMPTFFTVAALYFFTKKKYSLSVISLGIGGSYKMFPLLLLIPASFIFTDKLKERIKYVLVGLAPFVITIIPYINSKAFRYMVFSPKSQKMLFMGWNVSGAEVIYPFILVLIIIYLYVYFSKVKHELVTVFLAVLLLVYSVTHYHPQWFIWVTPLLVFQQVRDKFKYFEIILVFFFSWVFITAFFEPSLTLGLFNPINASLNNLQGLETLLGKYVNVFQLKSIVRSVFAASAVYYVYLLFKKNADFQR